MDEKGTWWPLNCLFLCHQLEQHLMATKCFFFIFIDERTWWPSCVCFLVYSLRIKRALGCHQVPFSSLSIEKAFGGHQVFFFFSWSTKMPLGSHQVHFLSLCRLEKHLTATKCLFLLFMD
jgi:hypothetical protein